MGNKGFWYIWDTRISFFVGNISTTRSRSPKKLQVDSTSRCILQLAAFHLLALQSNRYKDTATNVYVSYAFVRFKEVNDRLWGEGKFYMKLMHMNTHCICGIHSLLSKKKPSSSRRGPNSYLNCHVF